MPALAATFSDNRHLLQIVAVHHTPFAQRYLVIALNSSIGALAASPSAPARTVQAMIEMIVDKRLPGGLDRFLHGLQLLGNLEAVPPLL
jgi:hypothetical protein